MRKLFPVAVAAVVLWLAGCTDDPAPAGDPTPAPSAATSAPVEPTPTEATPTGSSASPSSSVPIATCMSGRYRLSRFVGVGASQTYGTGAGGDVRVTFDDGSYTMTGAGKDPIVLTLAGQQAQLLVDGTARGSFTTKAYTADFSVGKSTGSATLRAGSRQERLKMSQIATVLAPDGPAALACGRDQLIMVFEDVRLELERP